MPLQTCRLHQAHHDGGLLAGELTAHELPCSVSYRPGLDLPLKLVVVERDSPVLELARQRRPVSQCVVDCLGRGASLWNASARPKV